MYKEIEIPETKEIVSKGWLHLLSKVLLALKAMNVKGNYIMYFLIIMKMCWKIVVI
jgi:hypothetical protein